MFETDPSSPFLDGALLIASPAIGDPRFEGSVIFVCTHSDQGAMGLVLNRTAQGIAFPDLAEQLKLPRIVRKADVPVLIGGPVEPSRGFVLHSSDYALDRATLRVSDDFAMTGNVDVLRDLARGRGPRRAMLALGHSSWGPGQLEQELKECAWLTTEASREIVFGTQSELMWSACLSRLGIEPGMLHAAAGRA